MIQTHASLFLFRVSFLFSLLLLSKNKVDYVNSKEKRRMADWNII